ncbi:DUF2971 domain-containing protein [Chitiniphilus eburneus]|uniref:DUF2971 domain-containing protein n=1 Tax=Chitiniphilus eburneus TaxID=2571148 RepID=A0A4U0PTJ6_9NEIS|nr:DUF2971 domain-containing protein [Chitiniphilus eburneus]TJZ71705.1 DUF2971 domain-containing protein [Chitiniphilus eburneus]
MIENKDTNPSKIIYKYFGIERISFFSEKMIRYTQPGDLNDPFECNPNITTLSSTAERHEFVNLELPSIIQSEYFRLTPEQKAKISLKDFTEILNKKITESHLANIENQLTPDLKRIAYDTFSRKIGVLCLSEAKNSLLMWAHYAQNHKGFVVGLDTEHPHFHQKKNETDEFRHLRKVLYSSERPSKSLKSTSPEDMLLTKSSDWSYEKEWRIFRALSESEQKIVQPNFDIHLFSIQPECIAEVLIGARATADTIQSIKNVIRSDSSLNHVSVKQAFLHDQKFELEFATLAPS